VRLPQAVVVTKESGMRESPSKEITVPKNKGKRNTENRSLGYPPFPLSLAEWRTGAGRGGKDCAAGGRKRGEGRRKKAAFAPDDRTVRQIYLRKRYRAGTVVRTR
jgi:hypothetical protein